MPGVSAGMISMETWLLDQIEILRKVTDRPIVVRPHPRSPLNLKKLPNWPNDILVEHPIKIDNRYDSYNLAFDCHAMINYNSGSGIQAALAGTRPVVDKSSLAYPVGISPDNIERPYDVDRDRWLVEICHTEYTLNEIAQGTWLNRLKLRP